MNFYNHAMKLLDEGHFVTIAPKGTQLHLRYLEPKTLIQNGRAERLMDPRESVRIPALFETTYQLIEAGEEQFSERRFI